MGRFERENIAKKVNISSQVFAVLASLGLLIVGLQFFSKKTGFDFFNINYSLSRLFSDNNSEKNEANVTQLATLPQTLKISEGLNQNQIALIKAAELLQNHITLVPLKPNSGDVGYQKPEMEERFYFLKTLAYRSAKSLYSPSTNSLYSKSNVQNGLLTKVKNARYSKWAFGLSITPGLAYRQLNYSEMAEIELRRQIRKQNMYYQSQTERNSFDKSLIKYSFGIDFMVRLNNRIEIQSGLVYINSGESLLLKEKTIDSKGPLDYAGTGVENHYFFEGTPDFEDPDRYNIDDHIRFANNISYFEIPLIINYRIRKLDDITNLQIQAGASITKLNHVKAMVYNFDNDGYYLITGSKPAVFKQYGSNAIVGILYSKYITNTLQVFANPQFKFGLTNVFNSNYTITQHNYTAGVRLGMKINL